MVKRHKNLIFNPKNSPIRLLFDVFHHPYKDHQPVILFLHGFKGYKDWGAWDLLADFFASRGFCFIKFNFSGNGTSPEHPTEFVNLAAFQSNTYSQEVGEACAMIDAIETNQILGFENVIDPEKIILLGHSRGGSIALLAGAERTGVRAVITLAAVPDLMARHRGEDLDAWRKKGFLEIPNARTGQVLPLGYGLWEDLIGNEKGLDIPGRIKSLKLPVLAFHGEQDETVNSNTAGDIFSQNPHMEFRIIPGANHTFGAVEPWTEPRLPHLLKSVAQQSLTFLLEILNPASHDSN